MTEGPDQQPPQGQTPPEGRPAPPPGRQPQPGPQWGPPAPGPPQPGWGPPPPGWGAPPPSYGPPPGWAQAPAYQPPPQQRALPPFPHPEPREYHQMLRTWNYAWWKPVLGVVLVVVGMMLVAPLLLMPILVAGVALEEGSFWENFQRAATLEEVGPAALLYLNLSLGAAILVTWAVMRWVHRMRPRWLTSVVPKMRWKLLFVLIGVSVVALVAQMGVAIVIDSVMAGDQDVAPMGELNELTATTVALALIVLLTTPFQAAGEEYVFRGYLLQAVGSLSRSKWVALIVTASLFALAHGVQNFPLFFDRFMFGLIAGWLVIRTGGLEAGIAMHILNNFFAFGFALLFSDITSSLNVSEVGWENIPVTLTQALVYAGLTLLVVRRMDVQRRTAPPASSRPPQEPEPVAVGRM